MRRVCCSCRTVIDPGTGGPGEETSHGYCPRCYRKQMIEIIRDEILSIEDRIAETATIGVRCALVDLIAEKEREIKDLEEGR